MNLTVETICGTVRGLEDNGVASWKGIPYASSPKRFKKAGQPEKWEGIRDAFHFSNSPCQKYLPVGGITKNDPVSEDCLYLNIWSPDADDKKRPVMLWIYGGAYTNGSSVISMYNGRNISFNEDIIMVTFNYRLGVFGFVDFSGLDERFDCNIGITDQFMALKWVYENIENFGGDPENITIMGQSAGANSVTTFLTMPEARKYISKAIALSSYPASTNTKEKAHEYALGFLKSMKILPRETDKLFEISDEKLSAASVAFANKIYKEAHGEFVFLPVIDGEFIKEFPITASEKVIDGKHIPVILGTCENEGSLYAKTSVPITVVTKKMAYAFMNYSEGGLSKELIDYYSRYPKKFSYAYFGGDLTFRIPVSWYADRYSKHSDTYLYNFMFVSKIFELVDFYTIHGTDLLFLFSNFDTLVSKAALILEQDKNPAYDLSRRMGRDFSEFARTGKAPWDKYDSEKRTVKVYNIEDSIKQGHLSEALEVWKNTKYYRRLFNGGGKMDFNKDKYDFNDLLEIIAKLRAPDGCEWDKEQTHDSIRSGLIEETYEVIEAIDKRNDSMLKEELGDVLLQVVFHSQIAAEEKRFDISDVADTVCRKMIYRHPHVFGDVSVSSSEEVIKNWEKLKKIEKHVTSQTDVLRNVPSNLPALMRAEKIQKKAAQVGFDWNDIEQVFDKVTEEIEELREAFYTGDKDHTVEEMGDLLFAAVNLSRFVKTNPELALTSASEKFINRFSLLESVITEAGHTIEEMTLSQLDEVWEQIKHPGGGMTQ